MREGGERERRGERETVGRIRRGRGGEGAADREICWCREGEWEHQGERVRERVGERE